MVAVAAMSYADSRPAIGKRPGHARGKKRVRGQKLDSAKDTLGRSGSAGNMDSDDCIGTPMNRPANLGDRAFYTEQELAQRESQLAKQHENDLKESVAPDQRVGTGPPGHWGERARRPCKQTSLVVDPPNGRTPDLLPEAKTRPIPEGAGNNNPKADSWEDFSYYIRCISRGVTGSIIPGHLWKWTTDCPGPGYVTILQEMVHEARVIPTGWSSACESENPFLHGRRARPLGRQHAGCRDHKFLRQQDGDRRQRKRHAHQRRPEIDRAIYALQARTRSATK